MSDLRGLKEWAELEHEGGVCLCRATWKGRKGAREQRLVLAVQGGGWWGTWGLKPGVGV